VQKRYYDAGFQYSGTAGTENYYYVRDHLGSIRALVDSSGTERGLWNYDLWGHRSLNQVTISAVDSDFGYTGHYEHGPSGLTATLFRFYNSAIGLWISRDPLEDAELRQGPNPYTYVANNPINLTDPLGLEVIFNYSDGSRKVANTGQEFMDIASSSPKGSIDAIIIKGHGDSVNANFHPEDRNTGDGLSLEGRGVVRVIDRNAAILGELGPWLTEKFDPQGQKLFAITNCSSAFGPESIAKYTSIALKGIRVKASPYETVVASWGSFTAAPDVIYIDGKLFTTSALGF